MTEVTFSEAYAELFAGWWSKTPADFGIEEEASTPVCGLCLWQHCDRCRIDSGEWKQFGPPPLRLVLDGADYYNDVPPERDLPWPVQEAQRHIEILREKRDQGLQQSNPRQARAACQVLAQHERILTQHERRLAARQRWLDSEQEEPETVEYTAGAVVIHRAGSMTVIPTTRATVRDAFPKEEQDSDRPKSAMESYIDQMIKRSTKDDNWPLGDIGQGTLTVTSIGHNGNGRIGGTVRVGRYTSRREFSLAAGEKPTGTTAAYKAFVNAVVATRQGLAKLPPERRPRLVRFQVNSRGVRYQVLRHRCNAPHLQHLHHLAEQELANLTAVLGEGRPIKTACYQVACV